jgi:hypothetical protein
MAHAPTYELTEADTKLPASLGAFGPKLILIGIALVLAALGWDYLGMTEPEGEHTSPATHWQFSYLTAFFYWLTIVLGGMIFLLIQHVFRAGWSVVVRRPAEAVVSCVPIMALLSLPILIPIVMGDSTLYLWTDQDWVDADAAHMPAKQVVFANFLNTKFFLVRVAVYFGLWFLLSRLLVGASNAQDSDGDIKHTRKLEMRAAPGILAFALTLTFAGFDLLMSLDPHWFSTIWGVYLFAGSMTSFMSLLALLTMWIQSKGGLKFVNQEHYHDIGKLMFGFVVFFGYIGFSQFLLIWYANIPEETIFYLHRLEGNWSYFSVLLLFGHFIIPFLGLLSRHVKRHKPSLMFWAFWLLVVHFVDMYWIVMPTLSERLGHPESLNFHPIDLLVVLGLGGIVIGSAIKAAASRNIVPVRDPRLPESLALENI